VNKIIYPRPTRFRSVKINIDCLPPVEPEEIHAIANQGLGWVEQFLQGGRLSYGILSEDNREMSLIL